MKRSKFSLSNYKLLTCNQGELVPIGLTEVLPGDTFQHATSALIRVSPLLAPVMHPVRVRIHHWFVPTRIIWDDFEKFITGGPDGLDATARPVITFGGGSGAAVGSLADYLGVPTGINNLAVSALPFRAYAKIFNEWYRDQDLVTALTINTGNGADSTTSTALQMAAWEKDYFTSARPWPQKGADVVLPLGDTAPIQRKSNAAVSQTYNAGTNTLNTAAAGLGNNVSGQLQESGNLLFLDNSAGLEADLSGATAVSINDVREAFALQRFEEARARYGSRYTEYLRYLGVRSSDARLQRPEYLGGGKQTIQFSEVLQTGVDSSDEGVGTLRGHGIGAMRSNRYRRFFEEHGFVVSLISVLPKTIYSSGLHKMWSRETKEDYFQKELQTVGQQEIIAKEINAANSNYNNVWGYQDRYDEYRRQESSIAGEFRTTLSHWHMARLFSSQVTLNGDFVKANPTNRIYASTTEDQLYIMANHSIQARRLLQQTGKSYTF